MSKEKRVKLKVIEGGKGHGTPECDCPFCRCKCPVCGTSEIRLMFRPTWSLENDSKEHLRLLRQENFISVECPECGILEYSDDHFFQSDEDLSDLTNVIDSVLGLP